MTDCFAMQWMHRIQRVFEAHSQPRSSTWRNGLSDLTTLCWPDSQTQIQQLPAIQNNRPALHVHHAMFHAPTVMPPITRPDKFTRDLYEVLLQCQLYFTVQPEQNSTNAPPAHWKGIYLGYEYGMGERWWAYIHLQTLSPVLSGVCQMLQRARKSWLSSMATDEWLNMSWSSITPAEWKSRRQEGLCFYCGGSARTITHCVIWWAC